jgi:hypothetical protein
MSWQAACVTLSVSSIYMSARHLLRRGVENILIAIWEMAAAGASASPSGGEMSAKTAVLQPPLYNFLQSFALA